jgi:hypothetical protein
MPAAVPDAFGQDLAGSIVAGRFVTKNKRKIKPACSNFKLLETSIDLKQINQKPVLK